jgi:UDP-N-acetylmuramoylalanine--D-glutamate ligase
MKIAIAGYGIEGEANYAYWAAQGEHEITIVDEKEQPDREVPLGVPTILGPDAFSRLNGFDLVVRTASLAPTRIVTDGKIWSATNEFFEKSPVPIIGVTGTKGKGTTSSLIASMFKASGRKAWLVGNIGISALNALENIGSEDIVVFELSSFQLWDLERSPQTAVVLLIEADHLNIHKDMQEYVRAKGEIRAHQKEGDVCFYHPTNKYSREISERSGDGTALRYGIPDDGAVYARDGEFWQKGEVICPTNILQLIGDHNVENACAAISVARRYGLSIDAIQDGLASFSGLPHRLKFVREVGGVRYYDDSIATTPSSAVAALRSFTGPKVIILGGSSKGSDFSILAREMVQHQVYALLIGDEASAIAAALDAEHVTTYEVIEHATMPVIIERARALAQPGSVVLLSPSSASFGLFKNYADRGDQFVAAVNAL